MRHLQPTCGNMWGDEERRRVEGSKGAYARRMPLPCGRRRIGKGTDSENRVPKTPTANARQEFEGNPGPGGPTVTTGCCLEVGRDSLPDAGAQVSDYRSGD